MIKNIQLTIPAIGKAAYAGTLASITLCGIRARVYDKRESTKTLAVFAEVQCAGDLKQSLLELSAILPTGNRVEFLDLH